VGNIFPGLMSVLSGMPQSGLLLRVRNEQPVVLKTAVHPPTRLARARVLGKNPIVSQDELRRGLQ
jgi:hypothetical protein